MDLTDVQRLDDDWGASDALWAILPFTGRLLHVEDEFNPRSGWLSCTYFVAT